MSHNIGRIISDPHIHKKIFFKYFVHYIIKILSLLLA